METHTNTDMVLWIYLIETVAAGVTAIDIDAAISREKDGSQIFSDAVSVENAWNPRRRCRYRNCGSRTPTTRVDTASYGRVGDHVPNIHVHYNYAENVDRSLRVDNPPSEVLPDSSIELEDFYENPVKPVPNPIPAILENEHKDNFQIHRYGRRAPQAVKVFSREDQVFIPWSNRVV